MWQQVRTAVVHAQCSMQWILRFFQLLICEAAATAQVTLCKVD